MKVPGGFDGLFRQITPLILLGVLVMVVAEPWLPGTDWFRARFGDQALLRACVAVLGCYTLILWGESMRLHTMLTGVLQAFRQVAGEGSARSSAGRNPAARLEAARLLLAALRSEDPEIRTSSRQNLVRLVGEDLGDDPAAWQAWVDRQSAAR